MKAENELVRIKIIIAYRHNVSDTLAEPHTFNLALLKEIAVGVSMRLSCHLFWLAQVIAQSHQNKHYSKILVLCGIHTICYAHHWVYR